MVTKVLRILLAHISLASLMLAPFLTSSPVSAAGSKITSSPASISLTQGTSTNVDLRLTQPIICPSLPPSTPCEVKVNLTSNDPSVTILPASVTWLDIQWVQTRTVAVTAAATTVYAPAKTVTITVPIDTDTTAPFYSNAGFPFTLTLNNTNPPPYPVLLSQSVSAPGNASTIFDVLNGALNDPDPNSLTITSAPAFGVAAIASGQIIYTPNDSYVGSDTLTYQACNKTYPAFCSSAMLSVAVTKPALKTPSTGLYSLNQITELALIYLGVTLLIIAATSHTRSN